MWFDGNRQPNTLYVASISRGKDSTAMLRAIQLMGWPLDMIISVDIWATQDVPAELPPMVAFKDRYDTLVLERFGIKVTRLCAERERERETVLHRLLLLSAQKWQVRRNTARLPSVHQALVQEAQTRQG